MGLCKSKNISIILKVNPILVWIHAKDKILEKFYLIYLLIINILINFHYYYYGYINAILG